MSVRSLHNGCCYAVDYKGIGNPFFLFFFFFTSVPIYVVEMQKMSETKFTC